MVGTIKRVWTTFSTLIYFIYNLLAYWCYTITEKDLNLNQEFGICYWNWSTVTVNDWWINLTGYIFCNFHFREIRKAGFNELGDFVLQIRQWTSELVFVESSWQPLGLCLPGLQRRQNSPWYHRTHRNRNCRSSSYISSK